MPRRVSPVVVLAALLAACGGQAPKTKPNAPPTFTAPAAFSIAEAATKDVTLKATDTDGDPITFGLDAAPPFVSLSGKVLHVAPGYDVVTGAKASADFTVKIAVSDGPGGHTITGTTKITVTATDRPPVVDPIADVAMLGSQTRTVPLAATDPDGDTVTFSLGSSAPSWATVSGSSLALAPPAATTFDKDVTVKASDGTLSASTSFHLKVGTGQVTGLVTIDGGAAFTSDPSASLLITTASTGGAVTKMSFSNDGTTFSTPEAFKPTKTWSLDATADGQKTVTVKLLTADGASTTTTGTIGLDTTAPTVSAVTLDGGATVTTSLDLSVGITATDGAGSGVSTVELSDDAGATWTDPASLNATMPFTVPAGDGSRTVEVRVTDAAGNVTAPPYASASIVIDQTPPNDGTVAIDGGAKYTDSTGVTLALSDTDATSGMGNVCIESATSPASFTTPAANDPCFSTPYATSVPYTLTPTADGTQEVDVWFEDNAGNLDPTPATATIFLDRQAPTTPAGVSLVSVQYHTITLAYTASTDPAPSSGGIGYQVGFRLHNTTAPFVYTAPKLLAAGQLQVILSAAHSFDLVVRAVDRAGNASPDTGPVLATTYFPWTYENRLPAGTLGTLRSASVLGGDHFVVTNDQTGESWIDNADGFATFRRLDAEAYAIAPVGTTSRALLAGPFGFSYTDDLGVTFWPVATSPGSSQVFNGAATIGTTTTNGVTTDRFVVVGNGGTIYTGAVTSSADRAPTGRLIQQTSGTTQILRSVARCDACTGDVLVAVGYTNTILRSTDGGTTWKTVAPPGTGGGSFTRIVAVPGTKTLFAAASGVVESDDGGQTWSPIPGLASLYPHDLAVSGSGTSYDLWVAYGGNTTPAVRIYDGSSTTSVSFSSLGSPLYGAWVIAAKGSGSGAEAVVGGTDGEVLDITQGGAAVARRSSGPTATVRSIAFADRSSQSAILVGTGGIARTTADHGQTWTTEATGSTAYLSDVHAFADGSAVAVGYTGTILARSATGTWSTVTPPLLANLESVACLPGGPCIIAGSDATIFGYDPTTQTVSTLANGPGTATYEGASLWADSAGTVHGAVVGTGGTFRTCTGCTTPASFSAEAMVPFRKGGTSEPNLYAVAGRATGLVLAVGSDLFNTEYMSTDDGVTWGQVAWICGFTGYRVANLPGTSTWYVDSDRGFCRSDDDGKTFTTIPTYTWNWGYAMAVAPNPAGGTSVLLGGSNGQVMYSGNGGL